MTECIDTQLSPVQNVLNGMNRDKRRSCWEGTERYEYERYS
jgi:hypothetical protein